MNLEYGFSELLLTNKIYKSKKKKCKKKKCSNWKGGKCNCLYINTIYILYVLQDIKNNNYFYL